ncbi:MAG: alpha-mannosidase [Promethearchaeota archaeon]|nr:MAG: alpha-mannosidase [Candidatus Lokiarchaeota archaeon]
MSENGKRTNKKAFKKSKASVGHYSGSERLDPTQFEERDLDLPNSKSFWFDERLHSQEYTNEIGQILTQLEDQIAPATFNNHHIFMCGQSHIDMCWLWRYEQTRKKSIKTLRKVVTHAKLFPDFKYAVSEPQLLQWIKEDDPELFAEIQECHRGGQVELVGGSWVEPDCMMPCGESIVRQRLYGMRFYRDEFGKLPEVEWFLDSFGYNRGLPQILSKSGAKYFWTTKITWNKDTTFPLVHFYWQSPDGSRILTSNFGQNREMFDQWSKFHPGRYLPLPSTPLMWDYSRDYSNFGQYADFTKPINPVGFFNGAGNGGHGPTHQEVAQMITLRDLAEKKGYKWNWAGISDYFNDLATYSPDLLVWNDELYLETHRGTFTVHAAVKRHNRRLEARILSIERLATLTSFQNPAYIYPRPELERIWKLILLNQFHDMLPGSSIPEVFDDAYDIWHECDLVLDALTTEISASVYTDLPLNRDSLNALLLFNPLNYSRKTRVFIPLSLLPYSIASQLPNRENNALLPYARLYFKSQGQTTSTICQPVAAENEGDIPDEMQNYGEGWWTVIQLEGNEILTAVFKIIPVDSPPLFVSDAPSPRLTNGRLSVEFDSKSGSLLKIINQRINHGHNLVYGSRNLIVEGFQDKGSAEYPAWDLQREYWKHPLNYKQAQDCIITVKDRGPIFSTLQITKFIADTSLTQTFRLFQDDPVLYCSWAADWKQKDVLLKIGLYTNTNATMVTSDQMYCAESCSTLPETPADKARFEKIMHQYVDISTPDNEWGIALINEGKYAFDASGGRLRISLHRSPKYPRPAAEAWVNKERGERRREKKGHPPKYSGLGFQSARFGVLPHPSGALSTPKGDPSSFVYKKAEEFNSPILVCPILQHNFPPESTLSSNEPTANAFILPQNIKISVLKFQEWELDLNDNQELIIRAAEICGFPTDQVTIQFPSIMANRVSRVEEVDLLERTLPTQKLEWHEGTQTLNTSFGPFEIKSFKIQIK